MNPSSTVLRQPWTRAFAFLRGVVRMCSVLCSIFNQSARCQTKFASRQPNILTCDALCKMFDSDFRVSIYTCILMLRHNITKEPQRKLYFANSSIVDSFRLKNRLKIRINITNFRYNNHIRTGHQNLVTTALFSIIYS